MAATSLFYFKAERVLDFVIPLITLITWYIAGRLTLPRPGTWLTKHVYIFRYLALPLAFGITIISLWFAQPNSRSQLITGAIFSILLNIPLILCAIKVIFIPHHALVRCGRICDSVFVSLTQSI